MKIIMYCLLIPIGFLFSNHITQNTQVYSKNKKIDIEINLGNPKRGCSKGFGICKFRASLGTTSVVDKEVKATANIVNGSITNLNFHRQSMSDSTFEAYFSGDYFVVDENFDQTILIKKEKIHLKLKAGKYKLKKTKLGYSFDFWHTKSK